MILAFSIAAAVLFGLGYRLVRKGSPFKRASGDRLIRKRRYKTLGQVLMAAAALPLALAAIHFFEGPLLLEAPEQRTALTPPVSTNPVNPPAISTIEKVEAPVGETTSSDVAVIPASPPVAAFDAERQKELEEDLARANESIRTAPGDLAGYLRRGDIYAKQKTWDLARKDYEHVLDADQQNYVARFNLADLELLQGNYDVARMRFAALEQNPDVGDLCAFEAFVCDLAGGHDAAASKELDGFNHEGTNASYYFANAAWDLSHKKPEAARTWLKSALHIFSLHKVNRYSSSLFDLGYLPTHSSGVEDGDSGQEMSLQPSRGG